MTAWSEEAPTQACGFDESTQPLRAPVRSVAVQAAAGAAAAALGAVVVAFVLLHPRERTTLIVQPPTTSTVTAYPLPPPETTTVTVPLTPLMARLGARRPVAGNVFVITVREELC